MAKKGIQPVDDPLANFNMAEGIMKTEMVMKPESAPVKSSKEPKKEAARKQETMHSSEKKSTDAEDQTGMASHHGKSMPKDMSSKLIDNFLRYDRTADKGTPIFIPTELNARLKEISASKYKRLSVRAIAAAILSTVVDNYDVEGVIDKFFDKVHYVTPSEEQLEERKRTLERVRKYRESK